MNTIRMIIIAMHPLTQTLEMPCGKEFYGGTRTLSRKWAKEVGKADKKAPTHKKVIPIHKRWKNHAFMEWTFPWLHLEKWEQYAPAYSNRKSEF